MDAVLARYAARPAPRYTSYPTAPHFRAGAAPAAWEGQLSRIDAAAPVSLYLHVPFCRKMCWYCGCTMKLAARDETVADYAEALIAEIDLIADRLPARLRVSHLHWGGGTPTTLDPRDLARAMERLRARFDIGEHAEVAIETDPRTLTAEMASTIGALGFTRASFGVQEFDPAVQTAINRVQPPDMVARAAGMLRAAGVGGINFDLIYGLPHQTLETLLRTIWLSAAMKPDRLALFGYAHVPWMAKNQRMIPEAALPDSPARWAQAEAAAAALLAAGYVAVGIDHFARSGDALAGAAAQGRLRRNFQGYTTDSAETLIPFGASAIGRTPEGFAQNIAETGAWARAVRAGTPPVAKSCPTDADDRARGWVIERLMCDFAVDLDAARTRFAMAPDWCAEAFDALAPLAADGLVSLKETRVALTERGRPLVRVAAAAFDAYLPRSAARHSVAV